MTRGEQVVSTIEYDLFENEVKGETGIFLKQDKKSNKCLIYYPQFLEWAEIPLEHLDRLDPDFVPVDNLDFVNRITEMKTTF